MKSKSKV